jgi:hypothetical protein
MYCMNEFAQNGRVGVEKITRCPQAVVRVSSEGDGDDGEELEEDGGDGDRRLPVALARSPTVTCRAGRQFASSLAIYYGRLSCIFPTTLHEQSRCRRGVCISF